ncbi:hypothetical protein RR46_12012 [Papilio xuthus]|uniref:Uncharacterized protein n=1 Tax=Papilio xuthus TaxID=66420 RepID=A0A194PPW2_PAPXU|nr:hypothetical protein RR46_12012 [Papilio xuthus]
MVRRFSGRGGRRPAMGRRWSSGEQDTWKPRAESVQLRTIPVFVCDPAEYCGWRECELDARPFISLQLPKPAYRTTALHNCRNPPVGEARRPCGRSGRDSNAADMRCALYALFNGAAPAGGERRPTNTTPTSNTPQLSHSLFYHSHLERKISARTCSSVRRRASVRYYDEVLRTKE